MTQEARTARRDLSRATDDGAEGALSLDDIRAQFPALERQRDSLPVAYFDGPGGTQVPRAVVDAMVNYLYHHNANTHWKYPSSAETDEIIANARQALADFVGGTADEIVFGANATTIAFRTSTNRS
jgi:selenocysteine lyase/cysteine desulfurase